MEPNDNCRNCAEDHHTSSCQSQTHSCVSYKSNDNASWSHNCLTFLKKLEDLNTRNQDNSLQFYPTDDPWMWTSSNNPPLMTSHPQNPNMPTINPRKDHYMQCDTQTLTYRKTGKELTLTSHHTLMDLP